DGAAGLLQAADLALGGFEPAEAVTAVDQVDGRLGRVLQVHGPVEGRVAAADDDAAAAEEIGLALDEVLQAAPHPLVEAVDGQRAGLEGTVAGGDDERAREVRVAVGLEPPHLL